ncbi:hypothetical protein JCM10207_008085 [Rhodosporidiobolus poonsookiae]
MTGKRVVVDAQKAPAGPMGPSLIVSKGHVYIAGAIGDHQDGKLVAGTVQDRTKRAFANVADRLSLLGLGLEDIVSVTIYLANYQKDFAAFNAAYSEVFSGEYRSMPCRLCLGVSDLWGETDVEVTCVAATRE